ncbi:MAG: CTP synthase [Candidatus Diapherotrites archaeon]|nr:CTP synthase [Candidatus Diapherotrites archaeon]
MVEKKVLKAISSKSSDEFYSPVPKNFVKGKTKFIFVTGSVMSGLGKGIFTASLGRLLVDRGLKVRPMKLEAYLNVDSGTINPYRHGEVFVLDDGTETDMDLGTYERFLDITLDKNSFVTSGRIYKNVIEKERRGEYLGRDVQFIPHVTGEAKLAVLNLAASSKADVVLVEIGGTVGDYENLFAIEAMRELAFQLGKENVCFVNLTFVLEPKHAGEFKSKAAQLGLRKLLELGITPDVIVCRSQNQIPEKIKEKISMNSGVQMNRVFALPDIDNIYKIPLFLRKQGVDEKILEVLELSKKFKANGSKSLKSWTAKNLIPERKPVTIGIVGKYTGLHDAYISILKALEHCAAKSKTPFRLEWIESANLEKPGGENALKRIDGMIIPGGFGSRGVEGKISAVKFAREKKIPFLGLCYGFQMAVIEHARNACGLKNANTTEVDAKTPSPVICILPEQDEIEDLGGTMRLGGFDVLISPKTIAHSLYGSLKARERFRHRFNVNTEFIGALEKNGMVFSGKAPKKRIMQILELSKEAHPFFVASQFHPELTSRPLKPNPLFLGFYSACRKKAGL